jgi:hypothetical protein
MQFLIVRTAAHQVKMLNLQEQKYLISYKEPSGRAQFNDLLVKVSAEIQLLERSHRPCGWFAIRKVQEWLGENLGDPLAGKYDY